MKTFHILRYLWVGILLLPATMRADVTWRVSVKLILGSSGQRPGTPAISDAEIQAQFDFANTLPSIVGRGIIFEKSEVVQVTPPANASKDWFSIDLTAGDNKEALETEAKANAAYAWRSDKINIYLNHGTGGGQGSFPDSGFSIIVIGADKTQSTPWVFIHETGHVMSLKHTHQGANCGDVDEDDCADECPNPVGGNDDGISDTLSDHKCFDQDGIALESFGNRYSVLSGNQPQQVDNTFFNIMSYHGNRSIFTTQQLDAMCDTSNVARDIVSHNNFVFVDTLSAGVSATGLSQLFPIGGPFAQLKNGIDATSGGDVVLIRPGSYVEDREIRKNITLRAVRRDGLVAGNATIRAK